MEAISTENTLGFFAQKSYKNGVRTDNSFFLQGDHFEFWRRKIQNENHTIWIKMKNPDRYASKKIFTQNLHFASVCAW